MSKRSNCCLLYTSPCGNCSCFALYRRRFRFRCCNYRRSLLGCYFTKDSCGTGGQASLNLNLIDTQRQTAHQPFFLLEVQPGQLTVILLGNRACLKDVVGIILCLRHLVLIRIRMLRSMCLRLCKKCVCILYISRKSAE